MSVSSLTDVEEYALQKALRSGSKSGLGPESESGSKSGSEFESESGSDSEDELFKRRLEDALTEAAAAEKQMSPEERDQYNAMVDAFKRNLDLERGLGLNQDEENILRDLLIEEQERQKEYIQNVSLELCI